MESDGLRPRSIAVDCIVEMLQLDVTLSALCVCPAKVLGSESPVICCRSWSQVEGRNGSETCRRSACCAALLDVL